MDAGAATVVVVNDHARADFPAPNLRPDSDHFSAWLMARHDGLTVVQTGVAPVPLEVRSAEARRAHLDNYLADTWAGVGDGDDHGAAISGELEGSHSSVTTRSRAGGPPRL